jgi:glutathione S-transferase
MFKTKAEFATFKQEQLKDWPLVDLPYLIDGDVKITETVPICYYIINKYASPIMLGASLQQTAILDMYCWSIDSVGIGLAVLLWAQGTNKELSEKKERFWLETVEDKMLAL